MFGIATILELVAAVTFWLGSMGMVYQVEQWRWKAKETNYVQEQLAQIQKEAEKESKAAANYEKKQEGTNDTYRQIDKTLGQNKSPSIICFDSKRLRGVNSALARKATNPTRPSGTVSRSDAAGNK